MLFDTGGDREDVRVEDDVFRREADFIDQDVVGAFADLFLARFGVGLAGFVEGHHHHGGTVAFAQLGVMDELLDAFLHADGVDDALALDALEAGFDHFPLGGVDHDRHAGDVRLAGNQIEEGHHGLLRIEHAFVHVDVDHLGAGFHLLQGDFEGFGVVVFADQPGETGGTGDVGTFADVDEQRLAIDGERLQARQTAGLGNVRDLARRVTGHGLGDGFDMPRRGAAAAADDVQEAALGEFFDDFGGLRRQFVVFAEFVGQAGVRVRRHISVGLVRQLFEVRTQLAGAQGAVEAHGNRLGVADRVPERFGGLARQGAAGGVGDGAGDHDRQFEAQLFEYTLHGKDRGLGVEGVENGFDEDQVRAAFDQALGGLGVVLHQFIEGHVAVAGVVHIRRQRAGTAGRAEHAGDEAWLVRRLQGLGVGHLARDAGTFYVQLVGERLHAVIGLGHLGGVEGVGFEDVGAGIQVRLLDGGDDVRTAEQQQVVVTPDVARPVGKPFAAVVLFFQLIALDHRAHAAVEDQDAFLEGLVKGLQTSATIGHGTTLFRHYGGRGS